ncbi:MAG: pyroglutamyl-peptidase I [Thermoplasmatota archaeon]
MKTVVTGFGPFDIFSFNPSEKIAEHLAEGSASVSSHVLPVRYQRARKELFDILEEQDPDILISFGLNGTIGYIAMEEIAINIRSSEKADVSGRTMTDQKISEKGPLAYRTLLPAQAAVEALRENGIPARLSYSAGAYLCNEVFYTGLEWAVKNQRHAGFVHVPMATEMIADKVERYGMPNLSMEMLQDAGRIVLDSAHELIR